MHRLAITPYTSSHHLCSLICIFQIPNSLKPFLVLFYKLSYRSHRDPLELQGAEPMKAYTPIPSPSLPTPYTSQPPKKTGQHCVVGREHHRQVKATPAEREGEGEGEGSSTTNEMILHKDQEILYSSIPLSKKQIIRAFIT